MRSTLEIEPSPADTSLARPWLDMYCRLASPQRVAMRPTMPMAVSTSALRRLDSARLLRMIAASIAALLGARNMISVIKVRMTRMMAPTSAVSPSSGWKTKQIPR